MAQPGTLNITFVAGDDYELRLEFFDDEAKTIPTDLSVTGLDWVDIAAQIRKRARAVDALATFSVDDSQLAVGVVVLSIDEADTAPLKGKLVWDVERRRDGADGQLQTIFRGDVLIIDGVTRP